MLSRSMNSRIAALPLLLALAVPADAQDTDNPGDSDWISLLGDQVQAMELTLEDALRIALEGNLGLERQAVETEVARLNWKGSWGAFDPVYSLDMSLNDFEVPATGPFVPGFLDPGDVIEGESLQITNAVNLPLNTGGNVSLTYDVRSDETTAGTSFGDSEQGFLTLALTQPLLRGAGRRFATADQREAEIAYLRQLEVERQTRQETAQLVENAYWDLVAAEGEVEVREQAVELGIEQLDQNRRRLEVGVGTEVDVLQAQTNKATQDEQLLLAHVNSKAARDALRALLFRRDPSLEGVEAYREFWDVPIVPVTALPEVDGDLQLSWLGSLARAFERVPELAQLALDIESAEVRLQRAASQRLPGLDFTVSFTSQGLDATGSDGMGMPVPVDFNVLDADALTTVLSLNFSSPIGNRTAGFAERVARARIRTAQLAHEDQQRIVVAAVREAVRNVEYQAQAVSAAETSRRLAERQLEAEQARYEEGLSTTFQVLEFQQDLAQARSTEKAVRAAYAKALVSLDKAEGVIGEDLAVER